MSFADPWYLLLGLLVPVVIFFAKRGWAKTYGSFRFSDTGLIGRTRSNWRIMLARNVVYLRGLAVIMFILGFARPQMPIEETKVLVEGVDIVIAIDASGSMQAMDFEMGGRRFDRLTVVKNVVEQFIQKRANDRIGIVAFASSAYTVCPLTLDHDWLAKNLERVKIGMMEDGTSIGAAITAALNRIRKTESKDKIIILLTDGRNNSGNVSPLVAAEAAKALGVRIYCIGAGTEGLAPFPVRNMFGETVLQRIKIEIDEDLLKKIADMTGGKYYRATDTESLWGIYDEIDRLEKTEIEEIGYMRYEELFYKFLLAGLGILMLEILLSHTVLRRIP